MTMPMSGDIGATYRFNGYRLDCAEHLLSRGGVNVSLTPKLFDILVLFLRQQGRLLAKGDLIRDIWPDTFVADSALTKNISELRKALGEGRNGLHYIETVPKQGYRFIAAVVIEWVAIDPRIPSANAWSYIGAGIAAASAAMLAFGAAMLHPGASHK
jgi:DNA-binding winged helix-turn-helix (wHTH) protein